MVQLHCRVAQANRIRDMAGEGCDAAFARQGVADQRQALDGRAWRGAGSPILAVVQDNI